MHNTPAYKFTDKNSPEPSLTPEAIERLRKMNEYSPRKSTEADPGQLTDGEGNVWEAGQSRKHRDTDSTAPTADEREWLRLRLTREWWETDTNEAQKAIASFQSKPASSFSMEDVIRLANTLQEEIGRVRLTVKLLCLDKRTEHKEEKE